MRERPHEHHAARRRLRAEPAYEDPATGTLSDAHLWEELLGDDVTPMEQREKHVEWLVRRGWTEAKARAVFGLPPKQEERA